MRKISLIVFSLLFSFLVQSADQATNFGENCGNDDLLNKGLAEGDDPFPSISIFISFQPGWEGFGMPWQDDQLEDQGWTPRQVSLVIHSLNIDDQLRQNETLYEKVIDELIKRTPFSNSNVVNKIWSFINSIQSPAIKSKLKEFITSKENLGTHFQKFANRIKKKFHHQLPLLMKVHLPNNAVQMNSKPLTLVPI